MTQAGGPSAGATRLRRSNTIAGIAFFVGGSLFAIGACVAQLGSGDALTAASIYFAGGLFFNIGGYTSLLVAINERENERWRWWSYEPHDADWLSAFVLFVGTIAFGISLIHSFLHGLNTQEANRMIWRPEMIGCILFLVSGHVAMRGICGRWRPCIRHDLGWWIVAINQAGSALFMVSALAGFTRPATSHELSAGIANWGTLLGALCFAVAGALQVLDRPDADLNSAASPDPRA